MRLKKGWGLMGVVWRAMCDVQPVTCHASRVTCYDRRYLIHRCPSVGITFSSRNMLVTGASVPCRRFCTVSASRVISRLHAVNVLHLNKDTCAPAEVVKFFQACRVPASLLSPLHATNPKFRAAFNASNRERMNCKRFRHPPCSRCFCSRGNESHVW